MQPSSDGGALAAAIDVGWGPSAAAINNGVARGSHREMVGLSGFEPLTSRLSAVRSSQLSYRPVKRRPVSPRPFCAWVAKEQNGRPEAAVGK